MAAPPSSQQLTSAIHKLLESSDINAITERIVRRNIEKEFELEENALDVQKAEIKAIITEWLANKEEGKQEEQEEQEEQGEEEEASAPAKRKSKVRYTSDEEEQPKKKPKKETKKKKTKNESEEEEEEEEEKPKSKKKTPKKTKKADSEEEEDESPKKKRTPKKAKKDETPEEKQIKHLREIIKLCGLRLLGLKGLDEKGSISAMKKILRDSGLTGDITKERAKEFGKKRAMQLEVESLQTRHFSTDLPRSARRTRTPVNYQFTNAFKEMDKAIKEMGDPISSSDDDDEEDESENENENESDSEGESKKEKKESKGKKEVPEKKEKVKNKMMAIATSNDESE